MTGTRTPEQIATEVFRDWTKNLSDERSVQEMIAEGVRIAQTLAATIDTPEQIALQLELTATDSPSFPVFSAREAAIVHDLIVKGVQAGIQAAWESWEPETAPGLVTIAYKLGDPDPTPDNKYGEPYCEADCKPSGICTWLKGHKHPQHVAGDGVNIVGLA